MKKSICILLLTALLLSMVACGRVRTPEQPETPTGTPSVPADTKDPGPITPEGIEGYYAVQTEPEHYVHVRNWGKFLTIEHAVYEQSELSKCWLEEFWPDEGGWEAATAQVTGLIQTAYPGDEEMVFIDKPYACAVVLTADGLQIDRADGGTDICIRDEAFPGIHTPAGELNAILQDKTGGTEIGGAAGCWYDWDGNSVRFLELSEDGYFLWLKKSRGEALTLYEGVWGQGDDGITVVCEPVGVSDFPTEMTVSWTYDPAYEILSLEQAHYLFPGQEKGCGELYAYEPEMRIAFDRTDAMCYVTEVCGLDGVVLEYEGSFLEYYYLLPAFLGNTDTVETLNQEMHAEFGPLIEDACADIDRGERPTWEMVYWEHFTVDTIVGILLCTYSEYTSYYMGFYYDTATDTRVYPRDVLQRLGLDEEAYLENLRNRTLESFESYHYDVSEEEKAWLDYDSCLAWTMSEDHLNLDCPLMVDMFGNIVTYVEMETIYEYRWEVVDWYLEEVVD